MGNDINNITSGYSWWDLLEGLKKMAGTPLDLTADDKPFPLLYEEIYLNAATTSKTKEIDLKRFIAQETMRLEPNEIHHDLLGLGTDTIFTTNYDLTFEKALKADMTTLRNNGVVKENLYSLFRNHEIQHQKIWHIHGSLLAPNTITLGYEHYGGYLQQMRNYLITDVKGRYKDVNFQALLSAIRHDDIKHHSWMDYFFTHDLFILGLNLDFVEMHLWWFLTIRTRLIVKDKIDASNTIRYYYPDIFEKSSKSKLDLLRINGIKTIPLKMKKNGRLDYYKKVVQHIDSC